MSLPSHKTSSLFNSLLKTSSRLSVTLLQQNPSLGNSFPENSLTHWTLLLYTNLFQSTEHWIFPQTPTYVYIFICTVLNVTVEKYIHVSFPAYWMMDRIGLSVKNTCRWTWITPLSKHDSVPNYEYTVITVTLSFKTAFITLWPKKAVNINVMCFFLNFMHIL